MQAKQELIDMKKEADSHSFRELLLIFQDELEKGFIQRSSISNLTNYFNAFSINDEEEKGLHSDYKESDSNTTVPKYPLHTTGRRDWTKFKDLNEDPNLSLNIRNRRKHKRFSKIDKQCIVDQLDVHNQRVWKVAKELMLGYSTVKSIQSEYNSHIAAQKEPFHNCIDKRRFNKDEWKAINNLSASKTTAFTVKDIKRELDTKFNSNYSEVLIRRYLKNDLKMSYRKSTIKPSNVDLSKLRIISTIFWYRISKIIDEKVLLVNIDESSFNCDISNDRGCFKRGQSAEIFNKRYKGSWSLILAITSDGDYYGSVLSEKIDSGIYIAYLKKFEDWLISKKLTMYSKVLVLQDNSQVHRANISMKFMKESQLNYWFLPAYSPEYAPVEKAFGYLKEKWRKYKAKKQVDWSKTTGKKVIGDIMAETTRSLIISLWRRFITQLNTELKDLFSVINRSV